ncbi:MAG: hypothetical protein AAF193_00860 [Bacteroidota bacterium]
MKTIALFGLLAILIPLNKPDISEIAHEPVSGTYCWCMDISTFTELTLLENGDFVYIDQSELQGSFKHQGKWTIDGHEITLISNDNNEVRPLQTKWKVKKEGLKGQKVFLPGQSPKSVVLEKQKN